MCVFGGFNGLRFIYSYIFDEVTHAMAGERITLASHFIPVCERKNAASIRANGWPHGIFRKKKNEQ